jgi:hypothetical protein
MPYPGRLVYRPMKLYSATKVVNLIGYCAPRPWQAGHVTFDLLFLSLAKTVRKPKPRHSRHEGGAVFEGETFGCGEFMFPGPNRSNQE